MTEQSQQPQPALLSAPASTGAATCDAEAGAKVATTATPVNAPEPSACTVAPLLPQRPDQGSASLASSHFNLVLAVLGAGQLTLPYALRRLGLAFGILQLVLFALLGVHSLHTLSITALQVSAAKASRIETYPALVVSVFGKVGSVISSILLVLYAWGGAVSFMIVLRVELGFLFAQMGTDVSGTWLLVAVSGIIIWPLSSLRDTASLKRFAPLGCIAAVFITIVVLASTRWGADGGAVGAQTCKGPSGTCDAAAFGSLKYWPKNRRDIGVGLPLLPFALNSSWAYIPILCTMSEKTAGRVQVLVISSSAVILLNYLLLSIYGYLMFCSSTKDSIVDSLSAAVVPGSPTKELVLVAKVALSVQLTLALPMRFFVARTTIGSSWGNAGAGLWQRTALAFLLVASAAGLACSSVQLATAIGLTSSICATMIIYIVPSAMDLKLQLPGPFRKAVSVFSVFAGLFVMVAGLVANLMGLAVGG